MKYLNLSFIGLILIFLLSGCKGTTSKKPVYVNPAPTNSSTVGRVVHLTAQNMGNVSFIDLQVTLPANTQENLLDYNGKATIIGTVESQTLPCLKTRKPFRCNDAYIASGNIETNSCSINNHSIAFTIVLFRGRGAQPVDIINITKAQPSQSCYLNPNQQ